MKSVMLESSVVAAPEGQLSCDLAGEAVILDIKSGEYYGLNAVGGHIWNLIQEPKAVNDVLSVLLEEYDVDRERCQRDLLVLLEDLAAKGLIQVSDGTAP